MILETLWSLQDDEQLAAFQEGATSDDLACALHAIEGAPPEAAAACADRLETWSVRVLARGRGSSPLEQARALRAVLGDELDLRGDREEYHHPRNSHLSQVVARRRGLPILLSLVWVLVGRRAGVPVEGIGLPAHFIVRVGGARGVLADPFTAGRLLEPEDCRDLVQRLSGGSLPWRDDYLRPGNTVAILERVLRNLAHAHARRRDELGVYRAMSFLCALRPDVPDYPLQRALLAEKLGAWTLANQGYAQVAERFAASPGAEVARSRLLRLGRRPPLLH